MNFTTFKRPAVFAHRGATSEAPENTLKAFEAAIKLGVDGIELDLQLTRTGRVVVFHDDTLQRLAGINRPIELLDDATLRTVRIQGEPIPTLEEVLDLVRDRCLLNLEIKTRHLWSRPEGPMVEQVRKAGLQDSVLFSSFNPLVIRRLARSAPEIRRGMLFTERTNRARPFVLPWLKVHSLNLPLTRVTSSLVERVHRRGQMLFVWTVNAEDDMKRMLGLGVDAMITDHPERLLGLILGRPV